MADVLATKVAAVMAVVGFMNKCAKISGVATPLLTGLDMGFGNEAERGPEGFRRDNVFASELTGPILIKNPKLLEAVTAAILRRHPAMAMMILSVRT